ncbi:hypothetical protein CFOL_v3_15822 [Cephalotus follicularis]|uniref:Uncharacterized protein n=1 Tax=Cephalotus follicularis TaxID=3775 RepID=A0A1Q3BWD6_CEPFO|nr:hypothetical protein CFOL_v3_15822 [Cephalotus follicularis]
MVVVASQACIKSWGQLIQISFKLARELPLTMEDHIKVSAIS